MDEVGQALNQALRSDGTPVLAGGYRKGDRVELHSLKGAAEHNGKCGTVVGRQGERVQVRLDDAKTLALKTTNLKKLVTLPDAGAMRRAFAELSAAEKKINASVPPGAGMEDPCAFCGGARPHGKNDEFLPCCGVSVCSGCSMAASMRGVPCGKCGKTVPSQPTDLLDAYARLAAAGHEGARQRGLTLAAMLKVPEATRRQFVASDANGERRRRSGLTESEGAEYVAKCLSEGRAPNITTARAFRDAKVKERTAAVAEEVAKARAEAAARGPPETPAAALPDELSDVQRELLQEAASADTCEVCGKVAKVQVCTGCKCVAYCSRPCQKQDWPRHKNMCKALRAMRKVKTPAAAIDDPAARQGAARCFFLRGALKLRTKNYAKAVEAYERGLVLDPTDVIATMNLGIALRNVNRHADAKPYLVKAHELDRDYGPACHNLAEYYYEVEEDAARARPLYKRATELLPTYSTSWFGLGSTLSTLKDEDGAVVAYERLLELMPANTFGRKNICMGYLSLLCRAVDLKEPDEFRRHRAAFERHLAEGLRRDPRNADFPKLRIVFDNVLKNASDPARGGPDEAASDYSAMRDAQRRKADSGG
jgi:tetratricopeptide (TPR) repeat protein